MLLTTAATAAPNGTMASLAAAAAAGAKSSGQPSRARERASERDNGHSHSGWLEAAHGPNDRGSGRHLISWGVYFGCWDYKGKVEFPTSTFQSKMVKLV